MSEVAKAHNKSISSVALRWTMQKSSKMIPIIGASKMSHLEDNLSAPFFELSEDDMKALDELSDEPLPYPYNLQRRSNDRKRD